jgi:DNA mismatch repair ATPase MutL
MIPLGQFRDTFIIAIDDEGISIIDQHVAHERVLFEQVMERLTAGRLESQRLLVPMLIEMSSAQRQALTPHAATLERFGLEIEEFGGDSLRLAAVSRRCSIRRRRRRPSGRSPRTSKGSTRGRASKTRCARSPRRWRATRR